ncbi:MAG TPA: PH domain-containing protein [Herpetosiphonaceae bacterium]
MAEAIYDRQDQLQKVAEACLPGETIEAVFDMKGGGTGFVGITTKRVIVYDKEFLRKNKAVVSIPYSRITSIATDDESGLFTGRGFFGSSKVTITFSGGSYEFEFRGADKAHTAHNLILSHMV